MMGASDSSNPQSAIRNPQSPRLLVAIATYNEIDNLPSLVDEILRFLPAAEILIVDDNSPDGTGTWCDDRARTDSRVKCVHRPGKQGLGSATLAAISAATGGSYDVVATMDADWSHDPKYLPALIAATQSADVALGSRYCTGGQIEGWPLHRRVLSRWNNRLSRLLLRLPVYDSSGAFRAYRVAALQKINLNDVRATGYSYLEEILWHLRRAGATFAEVPITFHERRAGKSKINSREAVAKLTTLLRLAISNK
jgi:dolichol-phosphate mannosyltransferase